MRVPSLHVVVTDEIAARPRFRELAAEMQEDCGSELALHLRLRASPIRFFFRLAAEGARQARDNGGWCVVNGRADVALTAGAQAVQLGRGALPLPAARRLLPSSIAVGVSVHGPVEAARRRQEGADFLLLGTIFESESHSGGAARGLPLIRRCRDLDCPIVAIGGISAQRVADVVSAGAAGVAVIRAVWESEDPLTAALELRGALAAAGAERS